MPSYRTIIRRHVKTMLTGKTIAGENVRTNRATPVGDEDLPIVVIYTTDEKRGKDADENDGNVEFSQMTLVVEGAIGNSRDIDLEEAMDDMADAIRAAIRADDTLGNNVIRCRWTHTEPDILPDARRMIGAVRMEFECWLYTHLDEATWYDSDDIILPGERPDTPVIVEPVTPDLPPHIMPPISVTTPEHIDDNAMMDDPISGGDGEGNQPGAGDNDFLHGVEAR